jgi:hypothetical protein
VKKRIVVGIFSTWCALLSWGQNVVVKPYIQPGDGSALGEHDVKVISWITDGGGEAPFIVQYGTDENCSQEGVITSVPLPIEQNTYYIYRCILDELPFDSTIYYKVSEGSNVLRKASFATRSKAKASVDFIVVGDQGEIGPNAPKVAYQIGVKKPQMGVIVGDIVYPGGRFSEYLDHYVPIYINNEESSPTQGSPILASSTFYFVIGNHDVKERDLGKKQDGMAAFYMWQPPLNGPMDLPFILAPIGPAKIVAAFKTAAGKAFPGLTNYSFDNGPAHFLALDANSYVNVANPQWRSWIENDLKSSKAKWKFVFFHQPGFHTSTTHYEEQHMRTFSPIFEACGVDVVFSGHVHNYERSKPFTFAPSVDVEKSATALASSRIQKIDGKFTIDEKFDGVTNTSPHGIVYIITGSGGAKYYNPEFTNQPDKWKHEGENNWAPFTTKLVADRSSFSYVSIDDNSFSLKQIDMEGNEIDSFKIEKH